MHNALILAGVKFKCTVVLSIKKLRKKSEATYGFFLEL